MIFVPVSKLVVENRGVVDTDVELRENSESGVEIVHVQSGETVVTDKEYEGLTRVRTAEAYAEVVVYPKRRQVPNEFRWSA